MGNLYLAEDRLDDAITACKRSIEFVDNALDRGHPRMAQSLAGAASVHALPKEFEVAEAFYKRALEIREKAFGPNHPETVRTMEALSEVYHKLGQVEESEKLESRALDIRTRKR